MLKKTKNLIKLKIGIVDDHSLLRESLVKTINEFHDCEVVLSASNGVEMVNHFRLDAIPDLVILDLSMPLMDGYSTAQWLHKNHPGVTILVLSMFDAEVTIIRLLRLGIKAFLKKDAHPNELHHAIKSIMTEGYYYPQTVSGKLANAFLNADAGVNSQPLTLNENEIRFLSLTCSDLTYKQMAKELFVSPRTVDNYRDHLFEKLEIKTRVGLAMYAIRNGITTF